MGLQNSSRRFHNQNLVPVLTHSKWSIVITLAIILWAHRASSVPVNVALNKPVTAMYTCGAFGMETYSTLTDAHSSVASRVRRTCVDIRGPNGQILNGQSSLKKPSYPPAAMVDGLDTTWWQSTSRSRTFYYGQDLKVEISNKLEALVNLDLLQEFLAEKLVIRLGDALTPQKIAILKSMDGQTFKPWIYAVSNLDWCARFFQTTIKSVPASLTDVICVGYVADDQPPGDVIEFDLTSIPVNLREWHRVRHLKLKFFDMLFVYPFNSLANTYNHYAVRELNVLAECPCNGQQERCEVNPTSGMYECICGGNTRGRFCESCLPLYNQYAFRYGQPCVACNCFEHSISCFYQASVEANGQSLDTEGNRKGGGVCTECWDNTAGINCEKCVAMYYRPKGRAQTAEDVCVPCACNASGSGVNPETGLMDCLMNDNQASPDGRQPGDCYCKANVQGSKCDTCKPGFYNLQQSNADGCTACACYTAGTLGASVLCASDLTGQCTCKANVQGRACDQCKDGFYGLASEKTEGCSVCDCDVGGSLNQVCDKLTGQCVCRSENILGRRCDSIRPSFYRPSPHGIFKEVEDSFGRVVWKRDPQYAGYSGRGYAVVNANESLTVLMSVPINTNLNNTYLYIMRYRASVITSITIQHLPEANASVTMDLPACADTWCEVSSASGTPAMLMPGPNLLTLTLSGGTALLDKLTAFPVEYLQVSTVTPTPLPTGCDLLKNTVPTDPAQASTCEAILHSVTMFYWGAPLPCNCDPTGSVKAMCDVKGGKCECQSGVIGRRCDRCASDHFGFSATGCTPCACDSQSSSCDSVTGQCQCPDNTFGRQCDLCLPNHWGWDRTLGCKPCDCNPFGSASLQCNATTGICSCRMGVEGDKCSQCQDGYHSLGPQGCSPCLCNEAGSIRPSCNKTSGQCVCKSNTIGLTCDTCKPGTFMLDARNTEGCLNCICMGVTTDCVSAGIKLSSAPYPLSQRTDTASVPSLQLVSANGTPFVLDPSSIRVETGPDLTAAIVIDLMQGDLFWKMPQPLVSQLLFMYGTDILFTVQYLFFNGQPQTSIRGILIDKSGNVLNYPLGTVSQGSDTKLVINLREDKWQKQGGNITPTRGEFLKALSKATALLIPASFYVGKHTARISRLEFSSVNDLGLVNPAVEQCTCGSEYSGRSCEMCAPGYKRTNVTSSAYLGVCIPCECNGHAAVCDPDTGACQGCLHNTTGASCESCKLGFYGNATVGTETDCTECPCFFPRVVNASCHVENSNLTSGVNNVVCDFCQTGYVGRLCDQCDLLYYGVPQTVGGTCLPCECNGNSATCNSVTGVCDSCGFNTTGNNCERCIDGFFGNATLQQCQECKCQAETSNSTTCDSASGQCPCIYGVGGRTCNGCLTGYWGFNSPDFVGCKVCECVDAGSVSPQCNADTGQCTCKTNTKGARCDTCEDNFFGLPTAPCQACACNTVGTVPDTSCNATTGQCLCQPGIGGRQCDQCLPLFVNFTSSGCEECGQCQKSLGTDVQSLTQIATEMTNRTAIVLAVQLEDSRLQFLTGRLNQSLDLLGLAGSSATSVTDLVANVTQLETALVTNFNGTAQKASLLSTSSQNTKDRSSSEAVRHETMARVAGNLSQEFTDLEQELIPHTQYLRQYNITASEYLSKGSQESGAVLTIQNELAAASSILTRVRDTAAMDLTNSRVNEQATSVTTVNASVIALNSQEAGLAVSVTSLTSALRAMSYTTSTVDNTLAQAAEFRSQAEELVNAVNSTLTSTEERNTEIISALASARTSARNTNVIYSGNAATILLDENDVPFPSGVTNFETGITRLNNLLTSVPVLIDSIGPTVSQSEAYVTALSDTLTALQGSYQNISKISKDAVNVIKNFEEVVTDLQQSGSLANDASKMIAEVQASITGEAYDKLEQEFNVEKNSSEAFRTRISALDYQPQALDNALSTASSRLDGEAAQWALAQVELDKMTAAAQTLNAGIKDTKMNERLVSATSSVQVSLTTAQSVADSATSQAKVLNEKEAELNLVQDQITRAKGLDTSVRQRLTVHQANYTNFQSSLTQARSLDQEFKTVTTNMKSKIELMEAKLAEAEALLARLRHPLKFDGRLGLQLENLNADTGHLTDHLTLNMKKSANFTDGVVFFVDNPSSNAELELGVANNKVFFEFNTGTQSLSVTSRAEICQECWMRIDASRYAATGHLTVTLLSTGGTVSDSVTGQVDANAKALILSSNLFLGTLPDDMQTAKVVNREFQGCLDNVKYQGQQLSLWTAATSTSQQVTCCQAPPALPAPTTTQGVSFQGFGYMKVTPGSILLSNMRQLRLEFRTFKENSTLLRVEDSSGSPFISLSIKSGFVNFDVVIGGQQLNLQSQRQYNSGQWVRVTAWTEPANSRLSVRYMNEGDNTDNKVVTTTVDLSPLNNRNILLGIAYDPDYKNISADRVIEGSEKNNNFAGCMRDVVTTTSDSVTHSVLTNTLVGRSHVTPDGCFENVIPGLFFRSATSWALMAAIDQVQQLASLEFVVVTEQTQGMLVYLRGTTALRFLYVGLFGGNVNVVYRQDSVGTLVSFGHYISDGQPHTIKVDCSTLRVSLNVDGVIFEEPSQTLSNKFLSFSPTAKLYLGGVEQEVLLQSEIPGRQSLIGGILELTINDRNIPLVQASFDMSYDASLAGVPTPPSTTPAPPVTQDKPLETCASPPNPTLLSLPEGFVMNGNGDINWSELHKQNTGASASNLVDYFERSFSLSMGFAVYKSDGVLLYMADVLANPNQYLTLYFLDGYLHLRMRTTSSTLYDIQLGQKYNTGQRYQLDLLKINDFAALSIPSIKDYVNTAGNAGTASLLSIPVSLSIYLGGVGRHNKEFLALPQVFAIQPSKINFVGAIYSLSLKLDPGPTIIEFPLSLLDRALYPAIPRSISYGISLSGANSYLGLGQVSTEQTLTFEIRLTTTSKSGLLFLLAKQSTSRFIAVDIKDQQLRLHIPPSFVGVTGPLALVLDQAVNVCDGQTHSVKLQLFSKTATVTVDGEAGRSLLIPTSHAVQAMSEAQFFIFGMTGTFDMLPSDLIKSSMTGCVMSLSVTTGVKTTKFDPTQFGPSSAGFAYGCPY